MKNINNCCVFENSIMNQPETNEMSENEKPILKKKLPVVAVTSGSCQQFST